MQKVTFYDFFDDLTLNNEVKVKSDDAIRKGDPDNLFRGAII